MLKYFLNNIIVSFREIVPHSRNNKINRASFPKQQIKHPNKSYLFKKNRISMNVKILLLSYL